MKKKIIYLLMPPLLLLCYGCPKRNSCDKSTINASISFNTNNNTMGTSINFVNITTGDTEGATYLWDFGDNTSSSEANPSHAYTTTGSYNIKLTVRNGCGKSSDALERSINIIAKPDRKILPMSRVGQQTMVWCWAACSEMVLNYYSHSTPQCYILSTWFKADCCLNPQFCAVTGALAQIVTNLNYFGGLKADIKNGTLTLAEIANEITNNRPIIIAYQNYQSGHVVVIFGYDLKAGTIHIYDPFYYNSNTSNYAFVVPFTTSLTYGNAANALLWTNSIYHIGY